MSLNLFQSLPSFLCLAPGDLFSFLSLPAFTVPPCLLCLFVSLFSSSLFVTFSSFCHSFKGPSLVLKYASSPTYLLWITPPPSIFMSQLPGEAAPFPACVWCCPMCTAEGADPRPGGGVQSTGGGHGVCTQGSRDGHRRGMKHNFWVI